MQKTEILTIADDTTGALDVAGSFFSRGYDSSVMLDLESLDQEADNMVFDLNYRYEKDLLHAKKFEEALEIILSQIKFKRFFLKIDSTLRGHIQSDVESLSRIMSNKPIFIAPAFPHGGRLCINGYYQVGNTNISETVFAQDAAFKLMSSDMKQIFPKGCHIGLATVEAGPQAIAEEVFKHQTQIYSFDTASQSDLESIALAATFLDAVCVGSSGLARAFPHLPSAVYDNEVNQHTQNIPSLFVIGSANHKSRQQRDALRDIGFPEINLTKNDVHSQTRLTSLSKEIQDQLHKGKSFLLSSPDDFINDISYMEEIERAMGILTEFNDPLHNLILVGGVTARGVLTARKIHSLRIIGEHEPGIPVSQSQNDNLWSIFTKAGGFGSQYVLNLIYRNLYGN